MIFFINIDFYAIKLISDTSDRLAGRFLGGTASGTVIVVLEHSSICVGIVIFVSHPENADLG